jgi:hypothetical protein
MVNFPKIKGKFSKMSHFHGKFNRNMFFFHGKFQLMVIVKIWLF